ncbi:hypothetical protein C8R45DRAFT_948473 [Mycena sanguinolenta]|nr:hypothetical protein C8R45DRAFT_948473 [Mycena sanguinolenta]
MQIESLTVAKKNRKKKKTGKYHKLRFFLTRFAVCGTITGISTNRPKVERSGASIVKVYSIRKRFKLRSRAKPRDSTDHEGGGRTCLTLLARWAAQRTLLLRIRKRGSSARSFTRNRHDLGWMCGEGITGSCYARLRRSWCCVATSDARAACLISRPAAYATLHVVDARRTRSYTVSSAILRFWAHNGVLASTPHIAWLDWRPQHRLRRRRSALGPTPRRHDPHAVDSTTAAASSSPSPFPSRPRALAPPCPCLALAAQAGRRGTRLARRLEDFMSASLSPFAFRLRDFHASSDRARRRGLGLGAQYSGDLKGGGDAHHGEEREPGCGIRLGLGHSESRDDGVRFTAQSGNVDRRVRLGLGLGWDVRPLARRGGRWGRGGSATQDEQEDGDDYGLEGGMRMRITDDGAGAGARDTYTSLGWDVGRAMWKVVQRFPVEWSGGRVRGGGAGPISFSKSKCSSAVPSARTYIRRPTAPAPAASAIAVSPSPVSGRLEDVATFSRCPSPTQRFSTLRTQPPLSSQLVAGLPALLLPSMRRSWRERRRGRGCAWYPRSAKPIDRDTELRLRPKTTSTLLPGREQTGRGDVFHIAFATSPPQRDKSSSFPALPSSTPVLGVATTSLRRGGMWAADSRFAERGGVGAGALSPRAFRVQMRSKRYWCGADTGR